MQQLIPFVFLTLFSVGCDFEHYGDCDYDGRWDEDWDERCGCDAPDVPVAPSCVLNRECRVGARCVDGQCEALPEPMIPETPETPENPMSPMPDPEQPEPSGCMADRECAGGECVDAMCHAACEEGSDSCGTGQSCLEGICGEDTLPADECATSSECNEGDTCVDTRCFHGCVADDECANPADFCDHGLCRPDWRPTTSCVYRADCGDTHCVDGQCRAACWTDGECGESAVCDGGYCSAQ